MFYNKEEKKYSTQMFLKMLFEEDMYKYAIITVFYLGFLNCCETTRQLIGENQSFELQERNEEKDKEGNSLDIFKQNNISINENFKKEENQEENLIKKEENQEENLIKKEIFIKEERCSCCHKIMKKKYTCFGKEFPCCCLICLLGSLAGSAIGVGLYLLIKKKKSNNSSEDEEKKRYAKEQECFYSSFPGEDLYSVTQKLKEMGLALYKDYSFCRQFDPNFYVFQINRKENFNIEKNKEELFLLKNISKNIKKEIFSNPEYYKKILFLGTEKKYINDFKKNGFSDIDIKDLLLEQFYEKLLENEEHFISCKDPQIFFNIFSSILGDFIFDIECVQLGSTKMTSLESLFENYTNITSVDLSLFDLSKVQTVKKCFYGCHNLTNLNLPSCVLMECEDISSIFRGCKSLSRESWEKFFNLYIPKLKNLSFAFAESNFDDFSFTLFNKNNFFVNSTANKTVTDYILENNHTKINYPNTKSTILRNKETINFTSIFEKCEKLRDVNNFAFLENCKNEVVLDNMFKNCSNLLNVNFSAFSNNISSINGIFSDCINLQKISAQYWSEHFFEKTEHKGIINDTPLLSTVCIPEGKNIETILFEKWGKISYKEGCYRDSICFSETCESEAILMIKNNLKKAGKNFCGNKYLNYIKCDVDNCVIYIEPLGLPFAFKGVSNMKTLKISNGLIPTSDLSYMFQNCKDLVSISLENIDTLLVTDMSGMFYNCSSLKNIDPFVKNINVTNVTKMDYFFSGCSNLENVNLENWNLNLIVSMSHFFDNCKNLISVILPNFGGKLEDLSFMFSECKKLKKIFSLDKFNPINVKNTANMFYGCSSLITLDLTAFSGEKIKNINEMFANCNNLTIINAPKLAFNNVTEYNNCFSCDTSLTKVCCPQNDKILTLLSNLWGDNVVYINGCYNNYQDQCTISDLKSELTNKFNNLGLVENKDYFWSDLSSENGFIVMKLNNSCFLSVRTLYVKDQSILANLSKLEKIVFLKSNTKITTLISLFHSCRYLKSVDFGDLDTQYVTNLGGLFYFCSNLETINFSNFNTQNVNNMYCMFYNCGKLASLDVSGFNTENVTNMAFMFYYCSSLTDLDISNFNTEKVSDMRAMFDRCSNLTSLDLSNFNTKNVKNMEFMFCECSSLTSLDVSNFNTEKVTNMRAMFDGCSNLTSLDVSNFNTEKVTDMAFMFYDCSSLTDLDLSNFNTPNLKNISYMFSKCKSLNNISFGSNFDTSNVTNMNNAFSLCSSLVNVKLNHFNTAKVLDMRNMFLECSNLASISISNLNINPSCSYDNLFQDCSSLKTICTAENLVLKNYLQKLWSQTPIFVENCYHKSSDFVCPYSDAKEELNNKMQELGLVENEDYFWYSKEGDFDFFVMQINDEKCFFSCKNLFVNGESIFKELVKLKNIKIIQNGMNKVETARSMFENCRNLVDINLSGIDFQNAVSAEGMFRNCNNLVKIDLGEFNTKKVESFASMFEGCENLISLNFEKIITEKCKSFRNMFLKCKLLKSINLTLFDTRLAEDMSGMFDICGSLERLDLSSFNTPNLTNMRSMFKDCHSLKEILWNKNFNTSKVTNMLYLFYNCESLEYITLSFFNTQQVMLFGGMFTNCKKLTNLDLSSFDTSNGTNMSFMFYGCSGLSSLNLINFKVNNVVTMNSMFAGCSILKTLDLWNNTETSSLKDMSYLFFGCNSLNYINLKSFHTTSVTKMDKAFYNCESLVFLDLNNFSSQSLVAADYLFAKCWSLQEIYASNTFNLDTNVSTAGLFEEDFNLRKICMNLNSDMLANLQSVIGNVTLNNGCYIRNNAFYFFYKENNPINISTNKNITDYNNSFSSNNNFLKLK